MSDLIDDAMFERVRRANERPSRRDAAGRYWDEEPPRESWLARQGRAENALIWSLVLAPIWMPLLGVAIGCAWAWRQIKACIRWPRKK